MNLLWLTDIHLNFLELDERINFYKKINKVDNNGLLITGDIAEAPTVGPLLKEMIAYVKQPVYFILGNHDFYRSNIADVKLEIQELTQQEPLLKWIAHTGCQDLGNNTLLVGQDSWADGRFGDYFNSPVGLNDSIYIEDFYQQKILGKKQLLETMQQLADEDAKNLTLQLKQAIKKNPKKIIILMHVPPFKEACLYMGKISNDDFLPYFASKIMGDLLIKIARENSNIEFLVLCGHTHSKAVYKALNNLTIKVGEAEYYKPKIQEIINT